MQAQPNVDAEKVGFFGASVGGSLALVAATDRRIAEDVDTVVSFGGYYDALETFGAIATHHIEYGAIDEEWTPRRHARDGDPANRSSGRVDDPEDRDLLTKWFVDREPGTSDRAGDAVARGAQFV